MNVKGNRIVFHYNRKEYKFKNFNTRLGLDINDTPVLGRFSQFDPTRLLLFDLKTDVYLAELTAHDSIHTLEEDMTEQDKFEFESHNNKLKAMKLEIQEMLEEKKEEVKEVIKRTGFKKKKVKYEQDASSQDALEEYYSIHGLDKTPAKKIDQIRITELDKVSNQRETSEKKFKKLQIIDEL
jgi:hypothetical protein